MPTIANRLPGEIDAAEQLKQDLASIDSAFEAAKKPTDPAKRPITAGDLDRVLGAIADALDEIDADNDARYTGYVEERLAELAEHLEAVVAEEVTALEERLTAKINVAVDELEGSVALRAAAGLSELAEEKVGERLNGFRSEYSAQAKAL